MTDSAPFDLQEAHRYLAAECFNGTWELIEKPDRTAGDVEEMIHRCHASRWHWGRFEGHTPRNLAVGAWQLARVYALAGRLDEAARYGKQYLTMCQTHGLPPFDFGFAYEALARIEGLAGNAKQRDDYLAEARKAAAEVADAEDRKWLERNLEPLACGDHGWPVKSAVMTHG